MSNTPKFVVLGNDGQDLSLPCHYAVCDRCNGTGVHDHPAFSNGLSQEDFDEDPDFREQYMRGHYDVACEECGGLRVVPVPDKERLTPEQAAALEDHYAYQRECAAERRMRERGIEF